MDLTLNQIIKKVNDIHFQINKLDFSVDTNKIKSHILELQNIEKQISSVFMKVSNIINICSNKSDISKLDKKVSNDTDWTYLNDISNINIPSKPIASNISINVKVVNQLDEIPNTNMYWVENINQFAVNINGVILRGNIGNIYNKKHIKKNISTNQTIICKYGNNCKNLTDEKNDIVKICKFYHDPVVLLEAFKKNKISAEAFEKYKIQTRNFINTSWIYTEFQNTNKNSTMRHFGSKNTLKHELDLMKMNNPNNKIIDNYMQQTMHDILVIMGLDKSGLLKNYPNKENKNYSKNLFSLVESD
jgi:hypothetical protein